MDDVDDSPAPTSPNPNPNPNPNPSDRHSPSPSLTLALATQTPAAAAGATVGGGGREDCWSEGATTSLIDAWGERYLHLGRGNLKQRHWQEVADAVTARDGRAKNPRTDVQCKNRIDTLKKKYKSERSKIAAASSGQSRPSTWRFFRHLDRLLGAGAGSPVAPTFPPQFPQRLRTRKRYRSPVSVSSGTSDSLPPSLSPPPPPPAAEKGAGEVARAVLRLGEAYERVERRKARLAAETERRRMEFVRELELQRMRFFVRTQMELSQLRGKHRRRRSSMDSNGNGNGDDNGNDGHHYRNDNGETDGDNME